MISLWSCDNPEKYGVEYSAVFILPSWHVIKFCIKLRCAYFNIQSPFLCCWYRIWLTYQYSSSYGNLKKYVYDDYTIWQPSSWDTDTRHYLMNYLMHVFTHSGARLFYTCCVFKTLWCENGYSFYFLVIWRFRKTMWLITTYFSISSSYGSLKSKLGV